MPDTELRYSCGLCDHRFDWTGWVHHNVECDACGESYCPTLPVCAYCQGEGFSDDDDEYPDYERNGIHDYSYKPSPLWHGGRDKPYYLGFELEISANRYNVAPIENWCEDNGHPGMVYMKEDGSVDGFEIVSHPMTPEYFDSVDWESFFTMLNANYSVPGEDEPHGHGLHVHVSRTAFPHRSTLARWSYLLNKNRQHTERVARRTSSHWAQFTDYPVSLLLPYEEAQSRGHWREVGEVLVCGCCREREWVQDASLRIRHQFQTRAYPQRYQVVNLLPDQTVEVRVFKSTRKPADFISSIHYIVATVEFVRMMQPWHATRRATQWEAFAEYVASHPVFSKESAVLTGIETAIPPEEAMPISARAIRHWASVHGFDIGTRGRIPSWIRLAYAQRDSLGNPPHTLSYV